MPLTRKALVLGTLAIAVGGAIGCTAFGSGEPTVEPGGCHPQVPLAYRIQTEIPVGTLEVRVVDASGSALASASITATRLVYTGAKCPSTLEATTDQQGLVRLERMKTGPYDVRLSDDSATASAQVEEGKTTSLTLKKP